MLLGVEMPIWRDIGHEFVTKTPTWAFTAVVAVAAGVLLSKSDLTGDAYCVHLTPVSNDTRILVPAYRSVKFFDPGNARKVKYGYKDSNDVLVGGFVPTHGFSTVISSPDGGVYLKAHCTIGETEGRTESNVVVLIANLWGSFHFIQMVPECLPKVAPCTAANVPPQA